MSQRHDQTTRLQHWIDAMNDGDPGAQDALLEHTYDRLRRMTRKMLKRYPTVRWWDETDDVLQQALQRIHHAMADLRVTTVRENFGLAARQIRWQLLDLSRDYGGLRGLGRRLRGGVADGRADEPAQPEPQGTTFEPRRLGQWTEVHEAIHGLPAQERELFD